MTGFPDTIARAFLDHVLTDPAWTPPTTLYIGLSSTVPNRQGGNFTEPSGGNYARIATTAADWAAATGSTPATKANSATKEFATASADWLAAALLTNFGLFDDDDAGAPVVTGTLTVAKAVLSGDAPRFGIGAMVLKFGYPADAY